MQIIIPLDQLNQMVIGLSFIAVLCCATAVLLRPFLMRSTRDRRLGDLEQELTLLWLQLDALSKSQGKKQKKRQRQGARRLGEMLRLFANFEVCQGPTPTCPF